MDDMNFLSGSFVARTGAVSSFEVPQCLSAMQNLFCTAVINSNFMNIVDASELVKFPK